MSDLPADTLTTTIAEALSKPVTVHAVDVSGHPHSYTKHINPSDARAYAEAVVSVLATHNQHTAANALRDYADAVMAEVADWDKRVYPNRWANARDRAWHAREHADRLAAVSPTPPTTTTEDQT